LYSLKLPAVMPAMTTALVELVYAKAGSELKPGDKILDLTIDLGSSFAQNCPPISHYRIVAREKAFVRQLLVVPGSEYERGTPIAILSSDPMEPDDAAGGRPFRTAVAGILRHSGMWSMSHSA
jgi:hypothetical protein